MELAERVISPSELEQIASMTKASIAYGDGKTKPFFIWRFDALRVSEGGSSITACTVSDGATEGSSLTITDIDKVQLIAHTEPLKSTYVHIYNAGRITALELISTEPIDWLTILDS